MKKLSCVVLSCYKLISSIIKTSTDLNFSLNAIISLCRNDFTNSYINFSADKYTTFLQGFSLEYPKLPCISDFTSPTPPTRKSGLKTLLICYFFSSSKSKFIRTTHYKITKIKPLTRGEEHY